MNAFLTHLNLPSGTRAFLVVLLSLFFQLTIAQPANLPTVEKALSDFEIIESQNRFIDKLNIGTGEQSGQAYNLPIGVKKIVGNIPFTIAVTNVKFGTQYGQATVIMKIRPTQTSKELIFGATNVTISYKGDLVGDITLSLLSDVPLSLGNVGNMVFKGGFNREKGTGESKTYVSLDCNGNFRELSIDADITLNTNTFRLAGKGDADEPVTAAFRTIINDWNDLYVNLSLPAFEIKGAKGFEFEVKDATLDLSDLRNPAAFNPDPAYMSGYFTLPDPLLWRGLYIEKFTVTFPEWFKIKNSSQRTKLEASRLLIDENGVTGDILGHNILPFEQGDASGWAFSVSDFRLSLLANNIKGFGFGGQINIPLGEENQPRSYEAYIANNEYLFKVGLGEDLDFNLFGTAKLKIAPTSYLQISLKNKNFVPRVVLNGSMALNTGGLQMEELTFTKLSVGTDSPTLSVESMGYGGEVKFANFPVTISDIRASLNENQAAMGFDVKINLMEGKIAAASRINLSSDRKDGAWKFKGVSIDAIKLENIEMAGFNLTGEIRIEKDHPVYGDYFGGNITAVFSSLSKSLKVNAKSIFGCKDFRYWYVEGQAMFPAGIPIGPLSLNGFVGGAYYRMAARGNTFVPDNKSSLGVKAGVSYGVGANVVTGQALFEMNFLSSGGIKNMKFYGTANMMAGFDPSKQMEALDNMRKQTMEKINSLSESLSDNLPGNLSGSDVAKNILSNVKLAVGINAYLTMNYDFTTSVFDADFKMMVSTPGNIIRGAGNNNEAGWAKLYFSPQMWFVHVGTPSNPVGLKIGLGSFSLSAQSYFMLGDKLENPPAPPKQVLDILGITPEQADYMKYPEVMQAGKGIGFGASLSFDTGDLRFLILYARFSAGAGFDLMLRDMKNYACEGKSEPVGINGWYANGQSYVYLQGELGVQIKLLFINKRIAVIKGATAALLQARFPNPTWIGGYLAIKLNVLGGLINATMKMKMSFGDDCRLVSLNGDSSPLDMPVIADLTPLNNDADIDVFFSPQATFNMQIGQPFDVQDENGSTKSYRLKLEDFYITDNKGQKVEGKIKWNSKYDAATFESKEILPPNIDMKVSVSVNFEEYSGGSWSLVSQNGKPARESKESTFKTGGAPNYIPLTNIEYCYPVIAQKNFFKNEATAGYVQLKKGQAYLFPDNFSYNIAFSAKGGSASNVAFRYDKSGSRLNFNFPGIDNQKDYELAFVASSAAQTQSRGETTKTVSNTITDSEGESFTVDYMQQAAQQIIKDGSIEILKYSFRSSRYNTLDEKIAAMQFIPDNLYINTDVRSLFLNSVGSYEAFDEAELVGSDYTAGAPLVSAEAILNDDYYVKDIAPLLYNWYPIRGISITGRDVNEYGVPPSKAFPLYDGYLSYINAGAFNDFMSKIFPYVYELPFYYNKDYYELVTKAVNSFDKGIDMKPLMPLIESRFPFIRQGDYKTKLLYILPGGKNGTNRQINYTNTLNWR